MKHKVHYIVYNNALLNSVRSHIGYTVRFCLHKNPFRIILSPTITFAKLYLPIRLLD